MIYLDHAAATPVSDKVLQAMMPYFSHDFFNPSAAYLPAKKVAADYEAAKAVISNHIGAKSSDLIITAGATEANNLAFSALDGEVGKFAEYPRGLAKTSSEDPFATTGANETSDAAARGARASVCPAEHEDLARAAR
ncbi:aminotransferase class V-fold PLP-dependent enzyme, partial [Candidatus Saccharibacteria bacterium]|nr:aminotransferase class V-fold PLP-dependent enzyme [Candidatus Saccharibacteria bacterium]